jgi:hypothetical protein
MANKLPALDDETMKRLVEFGRSGAPWSACQIRDGRKQWNRIATGDDHERRGFALELLRLWTKGVNRQYQDDPRAVRSRSSLDMPSRDPTWVPYAVSNG